MSGQYFDSATGKAYHRYLWHELSVRQQSYFRDLLKREGNAMKYDSVIYEIYIDGGTKGYVIP